MSKTDLVQDDKRIQHDGITMGAYGATLVQALARKDPNQAMLNAGTICPLLQFNLLF